MKKIVVLLVVIVTFLSCHKDDPYEFCHKQYGKLNVSFTDDIKIDFNFALLTNQTQTNFDIEAGYVTDDCLLRTGIHFSD